MAATAAEPVTETPMAQTPADALKLAKDIDAKFVDLKFLDFVGIWQHFVLPLHEITEETFEEGVGFDGSSIRGWQAIHASDMLVMPDPTTAIQEPFSVEPTLSLIGDIVDPITKEPYTRDPRNVAKKAETYLKSTGIADTAYYGPEAEFFILDDVRFDRAPTSPSTSSTPARAGGTAARTRARTSATSRATRRATSRSPPPTP